ncbi:serine hydrolase domain-containing protein [Tsuneonella mangrovi]|uniref:serine hydrolase domain-containing protein n=1 Tax=Tsuneonella mangrovi TaxID=1982042 RepID=UPI000BA290A7|nr:serine hydrolase domain-containing protein [Tsuneonella mangrovi]
MRKLLVPLAALSLAACASTGVAGHQRDVFASKPSEPIGVRDQGVLFWSQATRDQRFRHMDRYFAGFDTTPSPHARALPHGASFGAKTTATLDEYLVANHAAGIMVLQDGKIRYEKYGLGFGPEGRWTSFSVAKSFTSTLLGAAIRDGYIASLSDPVVKYLPALKGTAYGPVTVEQVATMTSGVKWNEDYSDPNSDVAKFLSIKPAPGETQEITYAKTLTREAPPGKKWVYKTLETGLLGDIVAAATGQSLDAYAKKKIVDPAGFSGGIFWMTDVTGSNIGGCCISLHLSDYARMGQWVMEGGQPSVPKGWFAKAGAPQVGFGDGYGYGYQWWSYPDGNFGALGIFGQSITIIPERRMVVAVVADWPSAVGDKLEAARRKLIAALIAAN